MIFLEERSSGSKATEKVGRGLERSTAEQLIINVVITGKIKAWGPLNIQARAYHKKAPPEIRVGTERSPDL
jgi:hypothetical protein